MIGALDGFSLRDACGVARGRYSRSAQFGIAAHLPLAEDRRREQVILEMGGAQPRLGFANGSERRGQPLWRDAPVGELAIEFGLP